jgi:hypothetical protein
MTNMNPEPDDFNDLRKLMALKRHEQPSPQYLDQLSTRIIARIERGEGRLSMLDWLSANFASRPSLTYACGLTLCGALGLTAVFLARQGMKQAANSGNDVALDAPNLSRSYANQFVPVTPPIHIANWLGNTNPGTESQAAISLFGVRPAAISVSYQP